MERQIRFSPEFESFEDGLDQILQFRKIAVMRTEAPGQLPDTFGRIEVGAVRRQEVELNSRSTIGKPRLKNRGMMEACIIHDHDHLSVRPGVTQKHSQEHLERLGVKRCNRESDEAAVGRTDGPENGHRLPGRGMKKHGIGIFWRNPHHAPRSVLLKVAFIGEPQINVLSSGQFSEFFYMRLSPPGRPERSGPWVCADGIPDDGKASGTGVSGDQKGAKSGNGGVVSKTLSPRVSPLFRLPDAA